MTDSTATGAGAAITTAAEPDGAPRLPVLDILRGIAILGILFMNISDIGGSMYAFIGGDPRPLGWTGADQVAWWLREVLANGTARCLLEMLFGAGMVILTDRAATRMGEWRLLRAYYFRNIVLLLFGLVHVFILLWPGDILHTYGLAALVAVLFRRLKPRLLVTIGLIAATAQLVGAGSAAISSQHHRADVAALSARQHAGQPLAAPERKRLADFAKREAERAKMRAEMKHRMDGENQARTGTARSWAGAAWSIFLWFEAQFAEALFVWEAASTMLIGAALYRWGILQGQRSGRFYRNLMLGGYAVGLGLRVWGAYVETRFDHMPSVAYACGEYARLATTLGHVGLVNLILAGAGARLLKPFEAAGRTALSLYVAQTLVTLWVLYPPWGFALYGHQGWAALMLTALAIDAALLGLAVWWTQRFRIAPVEWAWRSILAGQMLPMRLRARAAAPIPLPA